MRRWVSAASYEAMIKVLVAARHDADFTQAALAQKLGKPPSFIAKIELGERRIDIVEVVALARAMGQDPVKLIEKMVSKLPDRLEI